MQVYVSGALWVGRMSTPTSPAGAVETVRIEGVRIPLDPALMSAPILQSLRAGKYERSEARRLPLMIDAGERVVDLGGGIGFTSALVALQGRAELVVCLEGNPDLLPLIDATHRLNGVRVLVRNAVIAPVRTTPTVPFHLHRDLWASSLLPIKAADLARVAAVAVVTFQDLVAEFAPTMFIMDIEVLREFLAPAGGGEGDGLGAMRLDGVRKVVIELHPRHLDAALTQRVFEAFATQGFHANPEHSNGSIVLFSRMESRSAA